MSAFGAKRKARKIIVREEDGEELTSIAINSPPETQEPVLQATFKANRKPFKQSSLRKSINVDEDPPYEGNREKDQEEEEEEEEEEDDNEDGGAPLRSRPLLGRSGCTKSSKKRQSSSRLSFGPSEVTTLDDEDSVILGGDGVFTPKKTTSLASAAAENSAYKKGISINLALSRLPMRSLDTMDDDDDGDRPRYSKEYLSELQSSTPNTPQNIAALHPTSDDDMVLDPSELEGAMVVEMTSSAITLPSDMNNTTSVLTEAEIREKKARRARIAKQGGVSTDDFISLEDDGSNDGRREGDSYLTVLSRNNQPKAEHTRLIPEDEDLGEGFDEFVEDGGLSLGKRAEREARRKRRKEMASLISAAADDASDSDDSEAERRAAYEAAQTRAGMDGLADEREQQRRQLGGGGGGVDGVIPIPPKITPLPDLSVLVEEFKTKMRRKEEQLARMRSRVDELQLEREGILRREPEVQKLLNEAGERYRALTMPGATGSGNVEPAPEDAGTKIAAAKALLNQRVETAGERGLESLGTTPVRQPSQFNTEMEI